MQNIAHNDMDINEEKPTNLDPMFTLSSSSGSSSSSTMSSPQTPLSPESEGLAALEGTSLAMGPQSLCPEIDWWWFNEISLLTGNIVELLNLLVEPNALRNFGWPECSVDLVLQTVLVKCGKEPCSNPCFSLTQRLRENTKLLFSFIVDDVALETLFAKRPIEQVLEQVILIAKSNDNPDLMSLPL